ncbi:hypothetical protein FRB99_005545 [Tulasnella sp. 403]|nr:hypothetical protein FRB99_005545 [Tulasnella sp. 403]
MAPDGTSIWDIDYVNEEHMEAFARALETEDGENTAVNSPVISTRHAGHFHERTPKISALSDFAPEEEPRRRARQAGRHLPYPEMAAARRGKKGALRAKLRASKSYDEWKEAAKVLDEYMRLNEWKKEPEDAYYDHALVKKVFRSLRTLREQDNAQELLGVLEVCIRANFAGMESQRLYSETYYRTKDLIEAYVTEVERALVYIRETPKLSIEEKRKFFRGANTNLGSSALCLSGGASFGYYHLGVVRAFLDAKMLPRVIAGTSAGGLIAALVCTHTDDELQQLLVPELADKITGCEETISVWAKRVWRTGARFDPVDWARKGAFFTRGSLTFREAYELTGRVLNISVIPYDRYSPTKLLNYLTSPDCVIWSAIIASAAVPGILNPVVLMQKTKTGAVVPWNWGSRFKDGSLRVDIPLQSLNLLFNGENPHVHLFNFSPRGSAGKPVAHRRGKGWRGGFILSAAEQFLKLELTKNFKVIRDLELMPQMLGQDWSSVFLQRFDGVVTIWPRSRLGDWFRVLTDPDRAELERMMRVGQIVTWPKLHMIENRYRLEREIYRGRMAIRMALQSRERERVAPDVDLPADVDTPTPGAGPSSAYFGVTTEPSKLSRVPWPSAESDQLSIESDAEAGFRARDSRFFRREGTPSAGSNGATRRRKWAPMTAEEQEGEEGEDSSSHSQTDTLFPPGQGPRNAPISRTRSSSFIGRLKTRSFPALTLSSITASFARSSNATRSIHNNANSSKSLSPDNQREEDRWSGNTDSDEDEVPWTGAAMVPRVASRQSMVTPAIGLELSRDGKLEGGDEEGAASGEKSYGGPDVGVHVT